MTEAPSDPASPPPSGESPENAAPAATSATRPAPATRAQTLRIVVRPLPKVVFFYLTWIASLVCAIVASLGSGDAPPPGPLGLIWTGAFFFNVLVISFDFNEERSLVAVLALIVAFLALLYFGVLGSVGAWFSALRPVMNATFYWLVFVGFSLLYLIVWLNSRFDYWEFRPNEVVHRFGLFPKMKRLSTEDLRLDKEVPDVLERLLLGSGRLILTSPQERHPIVIEHVIRIGRIDDQIAEIMGVKAVIHQS
ncbi:MAG: hypothetical protein H8E31_06765 [Planctomycetes bacterium]|nr:hypothetical protein [Planctomycetota bacterium]